MKIAPAARMQGIERTLIRQIFDAAPADAINLGLGQPDLPTPEVCALAGVAAIAEGRTRYTSTAGDPELRRAIAQSYAPWAAGAEEVVVTVGSQEAMFAACLTLLDPGDEVLYPDPGYPAYPIVARLIGAKPVAYPLRPERAFRLDPRDVARRIGDRTRLVILCTPSNPTGAGIAVEDLQRLGTVLQRAGVPWLSDEIYAGFTFVGEHVSPAAIVGAPGLVVSGLSKDASMTGWRVGWAVGPAEIVARITAAHQYLVTCASSVSQRAALAALSPAGAEARRRYRAVFAERREIMATALDELADIAFHRPDGAFYYFVDVSRHGSSLDLARRILERQNVVTVPGEAFGENGRGWLRLSFACVEQQIREGVRRIGRELSGAS